MWLLVLVCLVFFGAGMIVGHLTTRGAVTEESIILRGELAMADAETDYWRKRAEKAATDLEKLQTLVLRLTQMTKKSSC